MMLTDDRKAELRTMYRISVSEDLAIPCVTDDELEYLSDVAERDGRTRFFPVPLSWMAM